VDLMHKHTFIGVRTFSIIVPLLCPLTVFFLKCSTYLKPNSVPIVLHYLFSRHSLFSNFRKRTHFSERKSDSVHRRKNEQVCSVGLSSQVVSHSFRLRTETNSDCASFLLGIQEDGQWAKYNTPLSGPMRRSLIIILYCIFILHYGYPLL
jgi:hypothetical protein